MMDAKACIAAVLRTVNDHTQVHPYGDGLLVDLPLVYGDGDAVRVLVEPMGTGIRVSDRATAATLLSAAGLDPDAGKAAEAFAETLQSARINSVAAHPGEIATFGTVDDVGEMILNVAQASMRVDQLRWLAQKQTTVRFATQVTDRVRAWAGKQRTVQRDAPIRLKSGRDRSVTAAVSSNGTVVYVQAVSAADRERAAEHCYTLFSLSPAPADQKVATLSGSPEKWAAAIVEELAGVADVEFYDQGGLERHLDEVAPLPQQLLTTDPATR